ncbi:MAG: ABC-F family ATP-binding cassette domain-containing protein [Clostridiales bacterium]|nr:ABC-F family ATP-binding cassette domain-containing protein [Clostridiales bacterium]
MLLSAENISKNYGTKQLLQDATLYLNERERIGIIGINGTGKSTLLKILAGVEEADEGRITVQRNARVAYLPQNPVMDDNRTVLEQVFSGFSPEFREVNEYEVKAMLSRLGINDFEAKIGTLSGGQKKRAALAATLIQPADVLILDEPTNHLDSEMVMWLEDKLRRFSGGMIMVTHDRYFLERVVTKITELSRGKLYSYEANYSKYLELKAERYEMAEASERKRQAILRREKEWIMRGARARGTKSKERIERYNALKDMEAPETDDSVQLVTMSSRLGKKLIEIDNVSKRFGENTVLDGFSYNVKRSDRIGIVGKNGAGKSTLLNLIAGRIEPDSGVIDVGATVKIGYFSQEGKELDPDMRVYDYIRETAAEVKTEEGTFSASQMLERFLFNSDLQYSPIGKLSGGERRRLFLLNILVSAPNILLLDEPTNDLDIETLTILEDYLNSFSGAVIAVSHDRYFLDKIAESIFDVRGGGEVDIYSGNFSDYLEKRPPEVEERTAPVKKLAEPSQPKSRKLKFSFKEQREYETIDADLAALEEEKARCEMDIAASGSDYVRLMELNDKLADIGRRLDEKTERWLYLTELAEQIESQGK